MAAKKKIAICLGNKSSIAEALLAEEYHKYKADHELWFCDPPGGNQDVENLALHLTRNAPDADMLVAVQEGVHPTEEAMAEEAHILFMDEKTSRYVEFYTIKPDTTPSRELARDLALLSRARSNIQTH